MDLNHHAPIGLLDLPLDLDRIVEYWRGLPERAADEDGTEELRAIEEEGRRLYEKILRDPASLRAADGEFDLFETEVESLAALDDGQLARFRADLQALATDPEAAMTRDVRPGGDLEAYAPELLWIVLSVHPSKFVPTARWAGLLAAACEPGTDPGRAMAIGSSRLAAACRRGGLRGDQANDFGQWLSHLDQLHVGALDTPADRAAKDLLWQILAPGSSHPDEVIRVPGATMTVEPGLEYADDHALDPYGLLDGQPAPARLVSVESGRRSATLLLAGADFGWTEKDVFRNGRTHTILGCSVEPLRHAYILQVGLARRLPEGGLSWRMPIHHRPVWLKRDGRNATRKSAWLAGMRELGVPLHGDEAVLGHFLPERRCFEEPSVVVRNRVLRELLFRVAIDDATCQGLLEELAPDAGRAIWSTGLAPRVCPADLAVRHEIASVEEPERTPNFGAFRDGHDREIT